VGAVAHRVNRVRVEHMARPNPVFTNAATYFDDDGVLVAS